MTRQSAGGDADFSPATNLNLRGRDDEIVGSGEVGSVTEELLPRIVAMEWAADDLVYLDETEDIDAAVDELRDILRNGEGIACRLYLQAELEDSDYYSIEAGDRGNLDYSREDLAADDYVISISVGLR